jgi:hypothetical protein
VAKNYRGNRFEVDWSLHAKHEEGEAPAGRVINVGAGGVLFACPLNLEPGDLVDVQITDHWGEQLHATVSIVWGRRIKEGENIYGCRFMAMADSDRRILDSLLSELIQKQIEEASNRKSWIAEDGSRAIGDPNVLKRAA